MRLQQVLKQLVRIRSVSPDPAARDECFRAAKFLTRLLEVELGAEVALATPRDPVHDEDLNPVVIGRVGNFARKGVPTGEGGMGRGWGCLRVRGGVAHG